MLEWDGNVIKHWSGSPSRQIDRNYGIKSGWLISVFLGPEYIGSAWSPN